MPSPEEQVRPSAIRNPVSIAGAWLTTLAAFAFLVYWIINLFGIDTNPYTGLIGFIVVPLVFVAGLLLIPLGIWREARRRRRGRQPWVWPIVDLTRGRTRAVITMVGLLTIVNIGIVTVATFGALHEMETNQFCGQVCHTPMTPEFTAHQVAPHAGVACVKCHVGPGAAGTVKAKMNGARQALEFVTGAYSRPIPSPSKHIPTPAETCVHCHDLRHVPVERTVVTHEYDEDETNTDTPTTLVLYTQAAHWHARADVQVEFIATDDSRGTIPYVKATAPDGAVTEYFAEGVKTRPAGEARRMDCLDCHSRPAHTMAASAEAAVAEAITAGAISRDLPFVRREAVAALKVEYANQDAAESGLRRKMQELYGGGKAPPAIATAATDAVVRLYRSNVFPEMKVTWGTYRSQSGHADLSGCFRCHDDEHKAASGKAIKQECEVCHKGS